MPLAARPLVPAGREVAPSAVRPLASAAAGAVRGWVRPGGVGWGGGDRARSGRATGTGGEERWGSSGQLRPPAALPLAALRAAAVRVVVVRRWWRDIGITGFRLAVGG